MCINPETCSPYNCNMYWHANLFTTWLSYVSTNLCITLVMQTDSTTISIAFLSSISARPGKWILHCQNMYILQNVMLGTSFIKQFTLELSHIIKLLIVTKPSEHQAIQKYWCGYNLIIMFKILLIFLKLFGVHLTMDLLNL